MNTKNQPKKKVNQSSKNEEDVNISSNPFYGFVRFFLNFRQHKMMDKIAVIITLIVMSIYPVWKITESWRNQHFINEKIHDYFVSFPAQQPSTINVAIFQFRNDITTDKELSIQDLFVSKFQFPFVSYTKYSLPFNPNDSEKAKGILKNFLKNYDIVIWGNSIWRDSSKKYKLNYSTNVSNNAVPEFSLKDGEFDSICYQKFNAILPSIVLSKFERLQLFDNDKDNETLLMDFFHLERDIIQNEEIMRYVSTENKEKLLMGAATVGYILGKMGCGKFYFDESINFVSQIQDGNNISYNEEILLGKLQYESGLLNFFHDYFDEGIIDINNSVKTFRCVIQNQEKYIEHWAKNVDMLSSYLPQDIEIKEDSTGKSYYYVKTPVDNGSAVSAALMIVPLFDQTCSMSGICHGHLGQSLYELGCQMNDTSLINEANEMFSISIAEKLGEHYMKENDYDKYSSPSYFDEMLMYISNLEKDTSVISSVIARQYNSLSHNINAENYPNTWAGVHYRISCNLCLLGQINKELSTIMKAIEECKMSLEIFDKNSKKMEWFSCQQKIAELYLIAYILSEHTSENNFLISESLRHYSILTSYCSEKGNSFMLSENILNLSIAYYINNLYSTNKEEITKKVEELRKYAQTNANKSSSINTNSRYSEYPRKDYSDKESSRTTVRLGDKVYTVDGYATLKLSDGIISLILSDNKGDKTYLDQARISLNEAINNFSHPRLIPQKAISYSIASLVSYQIWKNTNNESDLLEAREYADKSSNEFNNFAQPIDSLLIIHEFKNIAVKIKDVI